ncbi:hypothetical protein E5083_21425 [Streptomyces bauhiniae]|uniref:Uncharacterized protein n=1 Tax=Streptomyces bauhiniae TaxID=2340725 RepID=A0A4Z1D0K0_9ACTN|nr:hypothetical protein [Streptomyces bauhiniae]TGN74741.1 hypothetical protein E5083_21425 [Streptomyces bauhiniae]
MMISVYRLTLDSALGIAGPALDSTLGVPGAAALDPALGVASAAALDPALGVPGAAALDSTLGIASAAALDPALRVASAAALDPALRVPGAAALDPTLGIAGAATLDPTLGIAGAATLDPTLRIAGTATLDPTLRIAGTATLDPTLRIAGPATLDPTLRVPGATTLDPTLRVTARGSSVDLAVLLVARLVRRRRVCSCGRRGGEGGGREGTPSSQGSRCGHQRRALREVLHDDSFPVNTGTALFAAPIRLRKAFSVALGSNRLEFLDQHAPLSSAAHRADTPSSTPGTPQVPARHPGITARTAYLLGSAGSFARLRPRRETDV